MNDSQAFNALLENLLKTQKLAVVATSRRGHPYTSLVAFAADADLRHLYFVTPRTTRKYRFLTADGRVALLVNSAANRDSDFHRALSVTAVGHAAELQGPERSVALALYLAKHPYLSEFAASPTIALIRVRVDSFYLVKNFQNVMELHLGDDASASD
jgi:nitroimidazol reductase NimA-like FMN-containing flavoprotein (pyridoxamine 5'-phosphate oxidase superfamily)